MRQPVGKFAPKPRFFESGEGGGASGMRKLPAEPLGPLLDAFQRHYQGIHGTFPEPDSGHQPVALRFELGEILAELGRSADF